MNVRHFIGGITDKLVLLPDYTDQRVDIRKNDTTKASGKKQDILLTSCGLIIPERNVQ